MHSESSISSTSPRTNWSARKFPRDPEDAHQDPPVGVWHRLTACLLADRNTVRELHQAEHGSAQPWRMHLLVILRLSLMECLLTALWTFLVTAAVAAALWSCLDDCEASVTTSSMSPPSMPPMGSMGSVPTGMTSMTGAPVATPTSMGRASGMGSMRRLMSMSSGEPMCPPPTTIIVESLVAGFAAAATISISFSATHWDLQGEKQVKNLGVSGGFINFAVTFAHALRGHITPLAALSYAAFQIAGACLGGALLRGVLGDNCFHSAFRYNPYGAGHGAIAPERAFLLVVLLNTACCCIYLFARRLHSMALPMFVGFFYIAATFASLPLLGGHYFNQLRNLAVDWTYSADLLDDFAPVGSYRYVWWVGSLLAGVLSAAIDVVLFDRTLWQKCGAYRHVPERAGRNHTRDREESSTSLGKP